LDAPRALEALDAWAADTLPGLAEAAADPVPVVDVVAALLGLRLR
ncbi:cysteine--1-D-myo-inosityl 2-amino-2-deoxy-alpha-D-glucopyranoside ligase, partial [Micrococcus luteus]|nr:cysteine--1-D-myo-inosityl 2-amino-2-deoxy-alpha-D-glucopyranoside ligase [Micrococcus luteus]